VDVLQVEVVVVTAFNTGSAIEARLTELVNRELPGRRCFVVVVCDMAPGTAVTKEQFEVRSWAVDTLHLACVVGLEGLVSRCVAFGP
jgi:hypothetical protein